MSFLLHAPPPEVNMIRSTSRFTEGISSPQIPRITITPAHCGPIPNLDSLSDSESSESYLAMSDLDGFVPELEDVVDLISKTTEKGLALTAEGDPLYRMLVECSSADDTASGADAAVHTIVRRGFHFARRNMVTRRRRLVGGRSLWLVRENQDSMPKNAQCISDEQKQDNSNRLPRKAPCVTYEQKKNISNLVNSLPEHEMEIAFNIIRGGTTNPKDVVDDGLEIDIDELPTRVLYSLLRFLRVHHEDDEP